MTGRGAFAAIHVVAPPFFRKSTERNELAALEASLLRPDSVQKMQILGRARLVRCAAGRFIVYR
jgi:hypothetical protein